MRNTQYSPSQEVPIELRLQTYKEAIEIIEKGEHKFEMKQFQLCVLLPCIFWDLKTFNEDYKVKTYWFSEDTSIMFPELDNLLKKIGFMGHYTDAERLKFLRSTVAEIEQKLKNETK